MGVYLNPGNQNFTQQVQTGTYIDKTMLIAETNRRLNNADFKFVCISRPRRFGKSIAEDMLAAYYSKGADSAELFAPYKISKSETFGTHLNKHNVIKVDLNARYSVWTSTPSDKRTYPFIGEVSNLIGEEFKKTFNDIDFINCGSLADYIQRVYIEKGETFIIIIDEYDVLIREQVSEEEFKAYLGFLNSLFKNAELKPAITLAYLTGI
ncbi:MAG: AAA family ATPase, partial [Spirochaetales bacterium]|nr:AAA family ATPase [Spirochaetales bacterium]